MTTYYIPDITGVNPDYLQVNMPFFVYQAGVQLKFENSPVFASSIRLAMTDGSGSLLVQGTDYTVNANDIDQTAMSRAFLENANFTGQLVKSITFTSNKAVGKAIAASFQEFYLTQPGRLFDDGTPFEVTPDLIKSLVTGLADVRQQVAHVQSPVAPMNQVPALLPFDINASRSGNVVTGEVVTVNTVAGAKVIRLAAGAFFADSLTLTYNGSPLSKTTDYLPIKLSSLTAQTTNKSGIYQYILLVGTFSGNITVNYHAVGGDVQPSDVNALYELMEAIREFLNNNIFLTPSTIVETPAFRAFNARLTNVETNVRSILTGAPTYGDATSGSSVRRPIATTDSKFHWWTIAKLFQVQGSPDIITADQFKGRVFFPGSNISLAFTADVNLKQTRQQISFKTDGLVFDPTYTLFGDLSVASPLYPMVRLVWSQVSQSFSGACLQIGLPIPTLSDQMVVEDLSTTESCWILDKTGQFVTGQQTVSPSAPNDNNFTLPDGATLWSSASSSSYSKICVPTYSPGYLVYTGATVAQSQLATATSTKGLFNCVLPSYFPLANINSLVITMATPDGSLIYDVEATLPNVISGSKGGRITFVNSVNEVITMNVTLFQDISGNYSISLNIADLTPAQANSMQDKIRYIRAKV